MQVLKVKYGIVSDKIPVVRNKVVASPWRVIVRIWPRLLEGIQ